MVEKGWRTLNPYGHVSKANRMARVRTGQHLHAYLQIINVENGEALLEELETLLKNDNSMTEDEKKRVNEIANIFNSNGISDTILEKALS